MSLPFPILDNFNWQQSYFFLLCPIKGIIIFSKDFCMERNTIKEKVLDFFKINYGLGNLNLDEDLFKSGLVDSMALVVMIIHFEKEFNIKINTSDITVETFSTINKIIKGLEKKINV